MPIEPITAGGGGNVVGPTTSTDEEVARFNGTTGAIQGGSLVSISDAGNMTFNGAAPALALTANGTLNLAGAILSAPSSNILRVRRTTKGVDLDFSATTAARVVTFPDVALDLRQPAFTGLRIVGLTTSALPPSTTEYTTTGDIGVHKDSNTGNVYLAYNDGGTVIGVELTLIA